MMARKQRNKYAMINYLDAIPKKATNITWQENKNGMVEIEIIHRGFYAKVAQRLFKRPAKSLITLDKYGTIVWNSIDGSNSIYKISNIMENSFPKEQDLMLNRVVTFMTKLKNANFITI